LSGDKKLSLIIPAYNEERRIKRVLEDYCQFFARYGDDVEIIVVMDGCNDYTPEIVEEYSQRYRTIRLQLFPYRLGKGGGLIRCLKLARGSLVGFVDADGAVEAKELVRLVSHIELDGLDGVVGSRWIKGAKIVRAQSIRRKILSRGFNTLVRICFRLSFKDTQCGAKVFKKEVIDACLPYLNSTDFIFDVDLLYNATKKNFKMKEVPIKWENIKGSKVTFKEIFKMFFNVCKLRVDHLGALNVAY